MVDGSLYYEEREHIMHDLLLAIWHQDYNHLIHMQAMGPLIACLMVILFLESSFVFLPLPGDSLVLLAGGLTGLGVMGPEVALVYMPVSAGLGSLIAYWQGHALHGTSFMGMIERAIPDESLPKASRLLKRYGFLAMFSSRFIPFVRVLTPMLMGMSRLHLSGVMVSSFASAFLWSMLLGLFGRAVMTIPFFAQHQQLLTKSLLICSMTLFIAAMVTIGLRLYRRRYG